MESFNYHHLFYFWSVCQEGGFTKAAVKLRLSQSAISEQVRQLENFFGEKLITRTTRRLELTEAGKTAWHYADSIFATGRELLDFMKHRTHSSTRRKVIRIGALGSLSRNLQAAFLRPLLERKDVHFSVTVGDSKRLFRLLREHALDVVLSTFPAGEDPAQELYTHQLTQSPLCLVAAKSMQVSDSVPLDTLLQSYPLFLPTATLESRSDFDHYTESKRLRLNLLGEVDDVALLRVLALTGKGLVVLPRLGVADEIANKNLVILHEFTALQQKFYAITRQKKFPNPLIAELVRSLDPLPPPSTSSSPSSSSSSSHALTPSLEPA